MGFAEIQTDRRRNYEDFLTFDPGINGDLTSTITRSSNLRLNR